MSHLEHLQHGVLEQLAPICRKWQIVELSLFGSAVRGALREESDIDLLAVFDDRADWSLWDLLDLRQELSELFGREIDLVEKRSLENPFRRRSILRQARVIYAA